MGRNVTFSSWRLRIWGLLSGSFRLEAEDLGFFLVTVLDWRLRISGLSSGG